MIYSRMFGILAVLCAVVYFISLFLVRQTSFWTWIINPFYIPILSIIQHWAGVGVVLFVILAIILFVLRR
jgi:hypothetical protein